MASSLVLVLLVDNLPGIFLNKTLETIRPLGQKAIEVHQCDQVTQPIIDLVNKNILGRFKKPTDDETELNTYLKFTKHTFADESPETLQNLLDNSVENSKSIEKQLIDSRYEEADVSDEDKSECADAKPKIEGPAFRKRIEGATPDFPKTVPYLVAIFETLQNVTAQTCGGTLVAPNWVLTAASCVNLLGNMYGNSTNSSSSYTVIANSSDPLSEGSIHNVTQVMLHPSGELPAPAADLTQVLKGRHQRSTGITKTPTLALLRVEPAVDVAEAPLEAPGAWVAPHGADVVVYGWQLVQNDTTNVTSMRSTSISARALSQFECELQYGVTDSSGALCLATAHGTVASEAEPQHQMSSGGPVLWAQGVPRLAAVVLGESAPLAAAPVADHAAWLHRMSSGGPVLWARGAPRLAAVVLGDSAPLAAAPVADHAAWLHRMSSGGPVLWAQGGAPRLAAVLGDSAHAPLAAAPVADHAAWLHRVLTTH